MAVKNNFIKRSQKHIKWLNVTNLSKATFKRNDNKKSLLQLRKNIQCVKIQKRDVSYSL